MTKYSVTFYTGVKKLSNIGIKTLYAPVVSGLENIPEKGPYILAGNHTSLLDILLLACSVKEPVRFMAKKELFKFTTTEWFFYKVGAIPVDRKISDIKAVKTALTILRNDEILGIFPEGTRSKDGVKDFKPGTVSLSKKTKAPIIPFGISGEYKFRKKVYLTFGEPISNIEEIDDNPDKYLQEKVKQLVIR